MLFIEKFLLSDKIFVFFFSKLLSLVKELFRSFGEFESKA
jgi:hypothetical protein